MHTGQGAYVDAPGAIDDGAFHIVDRVRKGKRSQGHPPSRDPFGPFDLSHFNAQVQWIVNVVPFDLHVDLVDRPTRLQLLPKILCTRWQRLMQLVVQGDVVRVKNQIDGIEARIAAQPKSFTADSRAVIAADKFTEHQSIVVQGSLAVDIDNRIPKPIVSDRAL